ncbi:hypothetical protein GOAMR_10_00110 [Gordonia amarae NBRC 15530]|uniref:Uncharacterized protein n=1 Tax=Gordonia amarae NBRC 15530 TaxID=1075090 RepID=G7GKA9_9ACTN|nr:hypothetical protein GOAMR_10_00110 [Gordonia amarae NBRC 15530]
MGVHMDGPHPFCSRHQITTPDLGNPRTGARVPLEPLDEWRNTMARNNLRASITDSILIDFIKGTITEGDTVSTGSLSELS